MAVIGKYISPGDVDNWGEDTTQIEMQEIIDKAEQTIEKVTKDFFYIKTFHEFLNGNGKIQMFPGLSSKILSVNKMVISDIEVGKLDFTGSDISGIAGSYTVTLVQSGISENFYQNNYIGIYDVSETTNFYWGSQIISHTATVGTDVVYTLADALPVTLTSSDTVSIIYNWDFDDNSIYRNPILTHHEPGTLMEPYEFFDYDVFPKGKRNIEIWGTYGWRTCPKSIKKACIILCKAENDETLYSKVGYGMKSEKIGDYSYTRFGDSQKSSQSLTGISEADQLLLNYMNKKPRFGVA